MKDIIIMDDLYSPANVYIVLHEGVLLGMARGVKPKRCCGMDHRSLSFVLGCISPLLKYLEYNPCELL